MNSEEKNKPLAVSKTREQEGKPVIVAFASPTTKVLQNDLMEERILFQRALRSVERWQDSCRSIRTALEAGATVEPGIYRAEIVAQELETPLGFTFPITRLVVR